MSFNNEHAKTKSQQAATEPNPNDEVQALPAPGNLKDFLRKCLKKTDLEYTIKSITKYGDHRGSSLQALDVKFNKNNDTNVETLQLVFKTTLSGSISARKLKQFWKEVHFYLDIIPAVQQFEEVANIPETERIDAFARHFGSRLSIDPAALNADTDALIILENLKTMNFESANIPERFDKDELLATLKRLAKLHALFIAMRRLQPNFFYARVDAYLQNSYNHSVIEWLVRRAEAFINKLPADFSNISPGMRDAIENAKTLYKNFHINTERIPDTPYTTFYHSDLWFKNIMLKKGDGPNAPVEVKIVDFQSYYYGSFALDLIQFVLINGRVDDLNTDFKTFIDHYHSEFVKMLRLFNCPLDDYTNEKMWTEITVQAKISLVKIYAYLQGEKIKILDKDTQIVYSGKVAEDFYYDHPTPDILLQRWKCINDLYIENGFI